MRDGSCIVFRGVIEVYNVSSRANAIREYKFWCDKGRGGNWELMESEDAKEKEMGAVVAENNRTPLTLAPSSGTEAQIMAIMNLPSVNEVPIRIAVEDLFGKHDQLEVMASR
jgi:hypothetical protein